MIWCGACSCIVRDDWIIEHCSTTKHLSNYPKHGEKLRRQELLRRVVKKSSLSNKVHTDDHIFRLEVTEALMTMGIPLEKLANGSILKTVLEESAQRSLTDRSNLQREYVPLAIEQEKKLHLSEIAGRPIAVTFDETTITWCNFCVIVTFVDDKGNIQRRVVRLAQYSSSPEEEMGTQMSDLIIDVVDNVLNHPRELVKVFSRDGASINTLAVKKLVGGRVPVPNSRRIMEWTAQYSRAVDIKCYSHTADLCGADYTLLGVKHSRLRGPHIRELMIHINGLFARSIKTPSNLWAQEMGSAYPSHS